MRLSPRRFSSISVREVTAFSLYLFLISIAITSASNGSAASVSFLLMSELFYFQFVTDRSAGLLQGPGRQLQNRVRRETCREPPRRHRVPDLFYFPPFIQINQVDRKLHEKGVHRFAGDDPQALARLQPFVFQQAGPPFRAGIRHVSSLSQNGLAGLVPHQYFQF